MSDEKGINGAVACEVVVSYPVAGNSFEGILTCEAAVSYGLAGNPFNT